MCLQLPRVTRCCFCIPLRLSSLLIGYLSIIFGTLAMVGCSFFVYQATRKIESSKNRPNSGHTPQEWQNMALVVYLSFSYFALSFLYNLAIHIVLLVGVHLNKHNLLRVYYISAYVLFGMTIPLVVLTYVYMGFVVTIPVLKWAFIVITCITTVRSYYLDIMEEIKPTEYEMQNVTVPPQQQPLIT